MVSFNKDSSIKRRALSKKARDKRRQVRRIIKLRDSKKEREIRKFKSKIFNEIFRKITNEEEAEKVLSIYHKSIDLHLTEFLDTITRYSPIHIQTYLLKNKKRHHDQASMIEKEFLPIH